MFTNDMRVAAQRHRDMDRLYRTPEWRHRVALAASRERWHHRLAGWFGRQLKVQTRRPSYVLTTTTERRVS